MSKKQTTRKCSACGDAKPLDKDHFPYVGNRFKDGFRPQCLICYNDKRRKLHGGERAAKPTEEKLDAVTEHRLKTRVRELEAERASLAQQVADKSEYAEIIKEVLARQAGGRAPVIAPRERKSRLLEATPLALASDWHVEEEVLPEQVAGRNRYNLAIAKRRMQRYFEALRWSIKHQRDAFKIRDLILWLGGDFVTNHLHDDDAEYNQLSPTNAILFAQEGICNGIDFLLEDPELDQIVVPMNDGNHGREPLTRRMRHAGRTDHSLEVFMYAQIAMRYKNEKRLKFVLPTSQFTFLDNVYGRTIRALHGDVFKYSGGVGGIMIPLMKALAKWETVKRADLTIMGHWHQRINLPNLMINSSLIGYNNYAMAGGFAFEAPSQSLRMLEPKRFCSTDVPLWVAETSDDSTNH